MGIQVMWGANAMFFILLSFLTCLNLDLVDFNHIFKIDASHDYSFLIW